MTRLQKIIIPFFSMLTTGALLVVFAVAIGYATFIENDYGTTTAGILVYNATWFEILLFLLAVNLTGSIFYNKLIVRKKWPILLFHAAFLVILAGATITRLTSSEGAIHIREGERSNLLLTEATFLRISANTGKDTTVINQEVRFSPYTANRFKKSFTIDNREVTLENLKFVPSAAETIVEDPEGEPILAILAVDQTGKRFDFLLKENQSKTIGDVKFGFKTADDSSGIRIINENGSLYFSSPDSVYMTGMDQNEFREFKPDTLLPLTEKVVYQAGNLGFVLKKFFEKGKPELIYVPAHAGNLNNDAIQFRVTAGTDSKEVIVYGKKGSPGEDEKVAFGDLQIRISFGSAIHELPFSLRLNDFQIERYPGSNSPSSFASEVTLIDQNNHIERPFRIFMNNILKYRGYRFFQSSFDDDEKGTVLSVNYDSAGTTVTYIGYFLMALGMILTLFSSQSRFRRLAKASVNLNKERKHLFAPVLFLGLLLSGTGVSAQNPEMTISPAHAREFGTLLIQNNEGRIEPVNTLASEVLRKVAKKGNFNGLEPVQVMLEILTEPEKWKNIPLIKVSDPELRKILGATDGYVSFNNVLSDSETRDYRLREYVTKAYDKKPAGRNRFDKEVINVDERVNILYKFMNGGFLTIFPIPGDENNKWLSLQDAEKSPVQGVSEFASQTFGNYTRTLQLARKSGIYGDAGKLLQQLKENQKKYGAEIYPPAIKTKLEIFYVNFNIFSKLSKVYILLGLILLIFQFIGLLSKRSGYLSSEIAGFWLVFVLFIVHSSGLAIRWYISGHAPWSNGYETLIYISWATCLAGLIFATRSPMTLAVTTILSAISLFVAGMSWMSPELTNLVPVLKSYWLVIHVAVITASYGFFAVAALLGLVNLILMIILPVRENKRIRFTIEELVLIIGMAIIAGLFMLTIGSFLGGVWANESWGRYWGWDPKETWALVTILVYAFIVHMHKIPEFRGPYAVSLASLTGFASVLMTYFGVNYYLSGLHSYAQSETMPVPAGVYVGVILIFVVAVSAYFAGHNRLIASGSEKSESVD